MSQKDWFVVASILLAIVVLGIVVKVWQLIKSDDCRSVPFHGEDIH